MEHGRLLAIFYYIYAALTMACSCFGIFHIVMGMTIASGSMGGSSNAPPPAFGFLFGGLGLLVILIGWSIGVLFIMAGRYLTAGRNHTFCIVMACLACMNFPLGTVLGIFTILWLIKPEVQAQFRANSAAILPQ